ncbi:MAG: alpha/beta fold hydrolase [Bdellovibrionota bacterium]
MRVGVLALFLISIPCPATADQIHGLYAQTYGNPKNQALVFLHGGPGFNSYSFEYSTAEELSKRGYYVIVFDLRGSGRSEKAPIESYTFPNAVADVRDILTHYPVKSPILLGHSYGGTLAIRYAEKYPEETRAVVLIDAPMDQKGMIRNILDRCERAYQAKENAVEAGNIQKLRTAIFAGGRYGMDQSIGGFIFAHAILCGLYRPGKHTPAALALWKKLASGPQPALLTTSDPDPFAGFIRNEKWLSGNLLPELAKLRRKIYGIFGADDGLFSSEQLSAIQAALPAGHFRKVANASHNLFIDQQDEFLKFLDEVVAATSSASR